MNLHEIKSIQVLQIIPIHGYVAQGGRTIQSMHKVVTCKQPPSAA